MASDERDEALEVAADKCAILSPDVGIYTTAYKAFIEGANWRAANPDAETLAIIDIARKLTKQQATVSMATMNLEGAILVWAARKGRTK